MVAGEMHNTGLFFSKSVLLLFLLYPPHNDETFFSSWVHVNKKQCLLCHRDVKTRCEEGFSRRVCP